MADEILIGGVTVVGVAAATGALKSLASVLDDLSQGVREAFSVKGYQGYLKAVRRFGKDLADELLVLQMSFGRMKVAIAQAFAPLVSVAVPYINQAIAAVIRFAGLVGQFFTGILAGVTGQKALAKSADSAADAEKGLEKAAASAGRAVRRSVMGFDELNRLNRAGSGGSSGAGELVAGALAGEISPQVQAVVDQVLALLAPLLAIDWLPLQEALANLQQKAAALLQTVGAGLQWLWFDVLTPFAAWVAETLAPVLTAFWAAGLELVNSALAPVTEGVQALGQALTPVTGFIREQVIQAIQAWQLAFEDMTAAFREKNPQIVAVFQNVADCIGVLWRGAAPVLTALGSLAEEVFSGMSLVVSQVVGHIIDALSGLTGFLAGVFTGDWGRAWTGIQELLKGVVNAVISLLNSLLSGVVGALNAVVRAANKMSFTVPAWVPDIGGKRFGVNLSTVSAPQIPYLARGAVLPANKPFLAVVGDQKHGTNVEAPLEVIQQAVAQVLAGELSAGFTALAQEQRRTRQAVEAIRVGDSVIGRAAERYQSRMLTVNGL